MGLRLSSVTAWFPKYNQDVVLLVVDLVGTFVFAVEGALAGIRAGFDVFGLLVLSFVTALGGGTIRDVLIGAIPPNSIRDWRYGATAFAGGGAVFFFSPFFEHVPSHLMTTLDAAGLSLFAVAGVGKALEYGITPMLAIMMGAVTGAGGGTVRDVLLAQVPGVLNSDVYAAAALAGAVVMVVGLQAKVARSVAMTSGGVVCFVVRMVAAWRHWNLPKVVGH
jgi:uncharacterized membrane protein YeiH